jgi:hypothetical protein
MSIAFAAIGGVSPAMLRAKFSGPAVFYCCLQ